MSDQAAGLRGLFARRRPSLLIVAGSDPCKAAVALHFAREAAAEGRATVLVDGTPGQVASVCDVACRYELSHVLAGDVPIGDVLRMVTPNLLLLPAARALSRFGSFTTAENTRLGEALSTGLTQALAAAGTSEPQVDLIVVNAEEAEAGRAMDAFGHDARVIVVASDRATSLRGAYAEMKLLSQRQKIDNFDIVVPRFDDLDTPGVAFANLATAARRFLDIELADGQTVRLAERFDPYRSNGHTGPVAPIDEPDDAPFASSTASSDFQSLSTDEAHHAAIA